MKGKIFNAQEVQSILNGSKVMFRKVIKLQPPHDFKTIEKATEQNNNVFCVSGENYDFWFGKCPYQVGQKIFCKESFLQRLGSTQLPSGEHETFFTSSAVEYVADGAQERFVNPNAYCSDYWKKRPAQHMKQEHSRLTLLIKEIRVERLADIEEDCWKEGIYYTPECCQNYIAVPDCNGNPTPSCCNNPNLEDPRPAFKSLWNFTHKKPKEKFDANPWVWKFQFEVVKC